ncbi:MAG: AmmeMemoRadiSam system protein A [Gammaproteobacteria bacterium]|jgi:AmmeMemoRadiSam system protein A
MSLSEEDRATLHKVARASIQYTLKQGRKARYETTLELSDYPQPLQQMRATFVTLHMGNDLRGCIGTLEARQPLVLDVAHNARAAAFEDPRFPPLTTQEFAGIFVHISVLSVPEPISFESQQDLLRQLRPGTDGLILTAGYRKGTFLPSVWESLPTAEQFLAHLKQKAGLPADYWSDAIRIERYTTESF